MGLSGSRPVVLHVLEALGGGTARHLIDVVRYTPDVQHHVAIPRRRIGALSNDGAIAELEATAAGVHIVEMRRIPWHPRNAVALAQLRRIIGQLKPDIVHGHSSVGGALARMAARGRPAVTFYTANAVISSGYGLLLERLLGHWTDVFVAVSASEGELVKRLRIVPPSQVTVIPNGIDLETAVNDFDLRANLGIEATTAVVGSVSRLLAQKAPEVFVRACALAGRRLPHVQFVLVGSGPLQGQVDAEIMSAGLGGKMRRVAAFINPAASMGAFDLFVSSSRFEGGPYAPLEAMRAGVPVLLTDVVGNHDVVIHRQSGLLVPADDPASMAAAIVEVMSDPDLRSRLAANGQRRLQQEFGARRMGEKLRDAYLAALRDPTARS